MQNKYDLKKSSECPFWWVLTDIDNGIVCRFKEGEWNQTQEYTFIEGINLLDANKIASATREMSDWMINNYYEILFTSPQQIKQKVRREVGSMLKARREEMGWTIRHLELLTGIANNHISRIEQGKYNVTLDTLAVITEALGLEIDFVGCL